MAGVTGGMGYGNGGTYDGYNSKNYGNKLMTGYGYKERKGWEGDGGYDYQRASPERKELTTTHSHNITAPKDIATPKITDEGDPNSPPPTETRKPFAHLARKLDKPTINKPGNKPTSVTSANPNGSSHTNNNSAGVELLGLDDPEPAPTNAKNCTNGSISSNDPINNGSPVCATPSNITHEPSNLQFPQQTAAFNNNNVFNMNVIYGQQQSYAQTPQFPQNPSTLTNGPQQFGFNQHPFGQSLPEYYYNHPFAPNQAPSTPYQPQPYVTNHHPQTTVTLIPTPTVVQPNPTPHVTLSASTKTEEDDFDSYQGASNESNTNVNHSNIVGEVAQQG
jgi:hypothetical protein